MKKALIFVFCALAVVGLSVGLYSVFGKYNVQASEAERLGVEITTNQKDCVLRLPARLSEDSGLQATIPIKDGGDVTAVRITPVTKNGEVAFSVTYLSGNYDTGLSTANLNPITDREVVKQTAARGETLVVRDEKSKTSWELQVKAVSLSEIPANLNLPDPGSCGCAQCDRLSVCPNSCQCLDTRCGAVCCVPTGGCP